MSRLMNAVKRAVGADREAPAAPAPADLRAQYVQASADFIAAKRTGDQHAAAWRAGILQSVRARAQHEGHAEKMEAVWVDPPVNADPAGVDWYEAQMAHLLHGAPEPAPRTTFYRAEWGFWESRYSAACAAFVAACRASNLRAVEVAVREFSPLYREACLASQYFNVTGRFMSLPPTELRGDGVALTAWQTEAIYRLKHAKPSGRYEEAALSVLHRPGFTHSAVRLLAEWQNWPAGTSLTGEADLSHKLVRDGLAEWVDLGNIPVNPNPPRPKAADLRVDRVMVRFLRNCALPRSGALRAEGARELVSREEAEQLIGLGNAEYLLELPFAPPPPLSVFGSPAA